MAPSIATAAESTVNINDITVTEGKANNHNVAFTISLSAASSSPVSVTYSTQNGTAEAGSDYVAVAPTTITFAAGQTSKTNNIPVTGDTLDELTEVFYVNISAVGATVGKAQGICTIPDDDPTPVFSASEVFMYEGNGSSIATVTVSLSGASSQPISVKYATANGTAVAGSDYLAKNGTLNFAPGQTTATIDVEILGETTIEPNETFYVNLSNPVNAVSVNVRGYIYLWDDDLLPAASVNDVTANEGGVANFTVTLSKPSTNPVKFTYYTTSGTAIQNVDYAAVLGDLTIPAGQTTATITVTIKMDSQNESDENFTLNLVNPVGATVSRVTGTGTITNLKSATLLTVSNTSVREGDYGQYELYFTIALAAPLSTPVTVNYATEGVTATANSDYIPVSGSIVIPAGKQSVPIAVTIIGDTISESSETFRLAVIGHMPEGSWQYAGVGTIEDDDRISNFAASNQSTASVVSDGKS